MLDDAIENKIMGLFCFGENSQKYYRHKYRNERIQKDTNMVSCDRLPYKPKYTLKNKYYAQMLYKYF